ncbi:MAG: SOS response-associated peptidase [Candidatus Micrarchaeia archaeon]
MCLRYAFSVMDRDEVKQRFALVQIAYELEARYNIAPTQSVPAIFNDSKNTLSGALWGMPAQWANEPGKLLFNARAESIDSKPTFRRHFEESRCLMPANAFYEWKHPEKRPFRFSLKDDAMFAFAAIYSIDKESQRRSCCMITTENNALVGQVHNRMPVILPLMREKEFLDATPKEAKAMLVPFPDSLMGMYELTSRINSSRVDSPEIIKPQTEKGTLKEYF